MAMDEITPAVAPADLADVTEFASGGLFTGFEGYATPTVDDYQQAMRQGIVVPDANVLLNLYRYTADARDDLLAVLARLGDRLWVPHQVLHEFWRNRESVLRDPRGTEKTLADLTTLRDRAASTFRTWANRVSLPAEKMEHITTLLKSLNDDFDAVMSGIDEFADATAVEAARDTTKDQVLNALGPILKNRVGSALDKQAYAAAVTEGLRRVEAREPPGYMDKKKGDNTAAGDYLVWRQVLLESQARHCDVLFVTGDVKEDWWRDEQGERRGPRIELVDELRRQSGAQLYMLRPTQLADYARTALEITVREESVQDIDRVDKFLSEPQETLPQGGWNAESLHRWLKQLELEAPVQAAAIGVAARQNGFVSRDQVYAIGKYPEGRSLKGFTRQINRITDLYRDQGFVPENAVDIVWAVYNEDSPEAGQAAGFRLHNDVLPLFLQDAQTL
jgi:hypothetical protein